MNLYRLLKFASGRKMPRQFKLIGLAAMFRMRRRTAGVFMDPILACNLRCRMCYFSDPEKRSAMKGIISDRDLNQYAAAIFPYALKLQIGCGAEPTLYSGLEKIIALGRKYGVPYISLTTNGQLLASGKCPLEALVKAGLDELTLSLHGTTAETYEYLMSGAKFELFKKLAAEIAHVKKLFPSFRLRVNYTVNSLNIHNLEGSKFRDLWQSGGFPDIVQLRPVQKIGNSAWDDFNPGPLVRHFDTTIGAVVKECHRRGIICISPSREQIETIAEQQESTAALIEDLTYVYVAPDACYKDDFEADKETYAQYHKRKHTVRHLLKNAIHSSASRDKKVSKKLNYSID